MPQLLQPLGIALVAGFVFLRGRRGNKRGGGGGGGGWGGGRRANHPLANDPRLLQFEHLLQEHALNGALPPSPAS